jgi:hypothetical protein
MTVQKIVEDASVLVKDIEHLTQDLVGDPVHLAEDSERLASDTSHLAADMLSTGAEKAELGLEDAGLMNFLMVEAALDSVDAMLEGARELGTLVLRCTSEEMERQVRTVEELRGAGSLGELAAIGLRSWREGVEGQLGGWTEAFGVAFGVVTATGMEVGAAYAERLRPLSRLAFLDWTR